MSGYIEEKGNFKGTVKDVFIEEGTNKAKFKMEAEDGRLCTVAMWLFNQDGGKNDRTVSDLQELFGYSGKPSGLKAHCCGMNAAFWTKSREHDGKTFWDGYFTVPSRQKERKPKKEAAKPEDIDAKWDKAGGSIAGADLSIPEGGIPF